MAYMVSKTSSSPAASTFNSSETMNLQPEQQQMSLSSGVVVTSQLHLRPESLDKDVILRRIQNHKCAHKLKGAFRAMLLTRSSSPSLLSQSNDDYWQGDQQLPDGFSSPIDTI